MTTEAQSRSNQSHRKGNNTGVLVGAAVAGAAVGLAANLGRRLFVQFASGSTEDWFEALKAEHAMTVALFDKLEATDDSQAALRGHLLAKMRLALGKHANEEENVIYPALREADERQDADHLTSDHGYVKTYLYELENMPKDNAGWLARLRDFRAMLEKHIREEEEEIFPAFRTRLSDTKNREITLALKKEGFKFA